MIAVPVLMWLLVACGQQEAELVCVGMFNDCEGRVGLCEICCVEEVDPTAPDEGCAYVCEDGYEDYIEGNEFIDEAAAEVVAHCYPSMTPYL